jgi:hypothetical protein
MRAVLANNSNTLVYDRPLKQLFAIAPTPVSNAIVFEIAPLTQARPSLGDRVAVGLRLPYNADLIEND